MVTQSRLLAAGDFAAIRIGSNHAASIIKLEPLDGSGQDDIRNPVLGGRLRDDIRRMFEQQPPS